MVLEVPESVEYDGSAYSVVAIGPRAFAGCEADVVAVPATVEFVDELALRGSAVAAIEVADGNAAYSSYDGMLFDAERISLLLIPEGKQGAARIPSTAEAVPPSAFSHCALVTSISVDAGSAAYLSRNGSLYDASGETLLRVPAGATEIVIADGCTAVAAGALEGCASLRSVRAPAGVAEVSPDVLGRSAADAAAEGGVPAASAGSLGQIAVEGGGLAAAAGDDGGQVAVVGDAHAAEDDPAEGSQASSGSEGGEPSAEAEAAAYGAGVDGPAAGAEVPADDAAPAPVQLTSLVALAAAGDDLAQVDPASIIVSLPQNADPAPWEAVGFEVASDYAADGAGPTAGASLDDLAPEDANDHDAEEPDGASSEGPVIADEVTVDYGYANERSMDSYERAIPKVVATLRLQPLLAEGLAGEPLGEESQATASFLYEGCLYVIDPEGGAALVAVDPKRLAECVEDPTTLILPDYVDDGTWSYPLTRIAKGAFRGSGVERLWIPASATYLDYALEGCETLRYVEISEDSPVYSSKDGCLYDKAGETLWMTPEGLDSSFGVKAISDDAIRLKQASSVGTDHSQRVSYAGWSQAGNLNQGDTVKSTKSPARSDDTRIIYYGNGHRREKGGSRSFCGHPSHTRWSSIETTSRGGRLYVGNYSGDVFDHVYSGATAHYFSTADDGDYTNGAWTLRIIGISTSPSGPTVLSLPYDTSFAYVHCRSIMPAHSKTVSWDANGGSVSPAAITVNSGSSATAPTPSRAGYDFLGWYTAASGGSYVCGGGGQTGAITSNVTYYAQWRIRTYALSWDANGGSVSPASSTVSHGSATTAPTPSRTGYSFQGWWTAREGGSKRFDGGASTGAVTASATLYARWSPISYAVALDAAFPAFAMGDVYAGYGPHGVSKDAGTASVTATFDSAMPSATMPRATGYRFEGYFDDAGTKYYNADGSSARNWDKASNATLHARWSVERHELTLDVDNGEVPNAASRGWTRDPGDSGLYRLSYSIEWVEESGGSLRITLPAPAIKPGYATFDGWTGGGISKPSKSVIVQPWELADRAYTGAFSGAATYSASLDLAGGRFDPAPEGWTGSGDAWARSFTVESEAFSLPAPARDGYSFEGWAAVSADGSLGAPAKDVAVPKGSWGDRSWRAAWRAVSYRISYDLAGGSMSGERASYTIEDAGFELPVPAREGYSFQGWEVTGANGAGLSQQGVVTTVKQGTWGDLHATAKWATASYVATLDLAGGSFASAPVGWSEAGGSWTRSFTVESDAFELPTPKRAGHDFQGWALVAPDGSLGSPAVSVTVPKGTVGDRSYRAVWQARSYAITWHYSGQTIGGQQSATSSQAYGQAIAFPSRPSVADPAREHYDFEGWFTEREGGERVEAGDYLAESDSIFYARWRPVEYTVHLHLGDDDAYGEHEASIEKDGQALPLAPDGHFDIAYTVEDEVRLPTVTDDPTVPKPVREGMSFVGWVECDPDGSFDSNLVPSMEVVLPAGSHGDRHYRAAWSFALRFEVPSAVGFRFDLADDDAFENAPHGPVHVVSGDGVEMRSLSLGQLAVADVAVDVAGADPDAIVSDRSKVQLRVMDASLPDPWTGWVPLPTTSAPERVDPYDLGALGFGDGNALAPLASKPLRYDIEVQDPVTTLAGEVNLPLAKIVFTVKGLW